MIDVARDPRWGRTVEGPGEDEFRRARVSRKAKVRGFQASDLSAEGTVAATAKHLAAYGAVQAGREYASVDMSERQLHEVYLPPFQAAVRGRRRGDHAGLHGFQRHADDGECGGPARYACAANGASPAC